MEERGEGLGRGQSHQGKTACQCQGGVFGKRLYESILAHLLHNCLIYGKMV